MPHGTHWSAISLAFLVLLASVIPSACSAQVSSLPTEALTGAGCIAPSVCDQAAAPPTPLREKLGAHLLALSTSYADGGSEAVQTYARSAGLNLPEQRVAVQVLAASEQDVAGLEQRIEEVGGSVQSTFESSIFAILPVPELGALASGQAVWRMDMQRTVLGPADVVDLETEQGGRNAK